jgi:hypothetical protein
MRRIAAALAPIKHRQAAMQTIQVVCQNNQQMSTTSLQHFTTGFVKQLESRPQAE